MELNLHTGSRHLEETITQQREVINRSASPWNVTKWNLYYSQAFINGLLYQQAEEQWNEAHRAGKSYMRNMLIILMVSKGRLRGHLWPSEWFCTAPDSFCYKICNSKSYFSFFNQVSAFIFIAHFINKTVWNALHLGNRNTSYSHQSWNKKPTFCQVLLLKSSKHIKYVGQ